MHVELGPVSSASAVAWIDFAQGVVRELGNEEGSGSDAPRLPTDVSEAFEAYLVEWRKAAERGPVFRWSGDADTDLVEYLMHWWFGVAQWRAAQAEAAGAPFIPEEGQEFYDAAVGMLIDGLEAEGREASAEFAVHLREFWPGRRIR